MLLKARARRESGVQEEHAKHKGPKCKGLEHSQLPMLLGMKACSGLINNPVGLTISES